MNHSAGCARGTALPPAATQLQHSCVATAGAQAIVTFLAGGVDLSTLLGAFALVGIATTAIIQAVKDTLPVRRWYQGVRLRAWLARQASPLATPTDPAAAAVVALAPRTAGEAYSTEANGPAALLQLCRLAADGDAHALLNLPPEEMTVRVKAAMRAALEHPRGYKALFLAGARLAPSDDVSLVMGTAGAPLALDDPQRVRVAEARSRVWGQMERSVDGFELAMSYRWKLYVQLASFAVSALLAAVALWSSTFPAGAKVGGGTLIVLLSGFLAPVARDLTVVLKRLPAGVVS